MKDKAVLKWPVPVDDLEHRIGGGPVALVQCREDNTSVTVWTIETEGDEHSGRQVRVYGTGHRVPETAIHLGSAIGEPFVWHVFEMEGW